MGPFSSKEVTFGWESLGAVSIGPMDLTLALLLADCMALNKFLNFSNAQFPGNENNSYLIGSLGVLNEIMYIKMLSIGPGA